MTSQPKTPKLAYCKTGDWQLLRGSGLWLQRQSDGPLWVVGAGGLFLALNLDKNAQPGFDEPKSKLIIKLKNPDLPPRVGMGSLLQIKQFLPASLRSLWRLHPGYLTPNLALKS